MVLGAVQLVMLGVRRRIYRQDPLRDQRPPGLFRRRARREAARRSGAAEHPTPAPPPNERAADIILCADDYGISPAVSAAIRDLIARGRINATSVMVVAPKFDRDEATKLRGRCRKARRDRFACDLDRAVCAAVAKLRAAAPRRVPVARDDTAPRAFACVAAQAFDRRDFASVRSVRCRLRPAAGFCRRPPAHACVSANPRRRAARDQGCGAARLGAAMRPAVGAPAPHRSQGAYCSTA